MKKINIHNFWRSDAFIILMFALMSVISVMILWNSHFVILGADLAFHLKRVYEIHDAILHGIIFPKVSLNTFNQTGSAIMSLYPNLNIYPMAFLSLFIKSFVSLYYIIVILRNFFALILGYYACKSFVRTKKVSFIFSVAYTLSTFTLSFQAGAQVGISSSIIFMPMVLFGFLNLLKHNKWIELTLGMSAIILCHVVDTLIVLLFLLMMAVINFKKFSDSNFLKALGKAIVVTLLVTSIFWIPFLILMLTNNIGTPPLPPHSILIGQPLNAFFDSVTNFVSPSISLICLVGFVLSIVEYKAMSRYNKQVFYASIIFLYICSSFFPWQIFQHTIVEGTVQSSYRFFVIPDLLLTYLFAALIIRMLNDDKNKLFGVVYVSFIVMLVQAMGQKQLVNTDENKPALNNNYVGLNDYTIPNNTSFNYLMNGFGATQYDYYPKSSIKVFITINKGLAIYDGNKHIKMKLLGNGGYEFSNQARIKDLSLPFVKYNGINYQVKLDGKTVNGFANKNSLMTINNVSKGHHHIRIIVHNTKMQIVSYITSLIGLIILLGAVIGKYIKRR